MSALPLKTLEFCRPAPPALGISLAARWTPARLSAPGRQILSFSSHFASGIPTPIPSQTVALRADLEHMVRGAESRKFGYPAFGGTKVEPDEGAAAISENPGAVARVYHFISDISG